MTPSYVRRAVVAGRFYEGERGRLERAARQCVGGFTPPAGLGQLLGGIVPHAGWVFSGPTAAKVFATLAAAKPQTYVILGAVHSWGVDMPAVYPEGEWETPLGRCAVDAELAKAILEAGKGALVGSTAAHVEEHSIEAQVPFIQALSPGARIVPIAVPPEPNAHEVGRIIADALRNWPASVMVVASTDLTHYGMGYDDSAQGPLEAAMPWMRENDRRMIRLVQALKAEEIVAEAEHYRNACGAGAVAAATAAAKALGATSARVLEYTTSADVMPEPKADRAVGYVGMLFEKKLS